MPEHNHAAFLAALESVQDRLYRYALAVMGNQEDANDLASDTILAAYEQFDRLKDPGRFLNLLLTIASRKAKRRKFRSKRFRALEEGDVNALIHSCLDSEQRADLSILLDLLQTLPARTRETVVLFEVADLSLNEIHEIQGGTLSGVKSRLTRGRARLISLAAVDRSSSSGVRPVTRLEMSSTAIPVSMPYVR